MSKKQIIIGLSAALATFAGAFATAWLTGGQGPAEPAPAQSARQAASEQELTADDNQPLQADSQNVGESEPARGLSEKQLKSLVYEVREKIQEYDKKMRDLGVREARLQVTQDTLKKDIDELNRLRVELASLVANLKEQRTRLLETRAQIAQGEKANLTAIAATYDKMDPASASKILSSICAKQMETGRVEGGSVDDAVKILYYMTERTKAKLLAEMVTTEPKLTAVLCSRLKQIGEVK